MPSSGGIASRTFRTALFGACLAATGAAGAGCGTVTIAPTDAGWTVTGEEDASRATWTAGDVDLVVPLRYPGDATHVSADVRNRGPEAVRLTFAAPGGTTALLPLGRASGGPPSFGQPWSENVYPGRPIEVPAGSSDGPGTVQLTLLPDARWGPDDPAPVGSGITLDLTLATGSESVPCGFHFRVTGSPEDSWAGLTRTGRWVVVVLLSAVVAALVVWAD